MASADPNSFLPLTPVSFHVLVTLDSGIQHGYAVKRSVEKRTRGVVRLGAGTLYHAIQSLTKRKLVAQCAPPTPDSAGTSRWKFYRITKLGGLVLRAEVKRLESDLRFAHANLTESGV